MSHKSELSSEDVLRTISTEEQSLLLEGSKKCGIECNVFLGLGQDRFLNALRAGILSDDPTANVSVSGLSGSRSFDILVQHTKKMRVGQKSKQVRDWCYVYNPDDARTPLLVSLKRGDGKKFKEKVAVLLRALKKHIPKEKKKVLEDLKEETNQELQMLVGEFAGQVGDYGFLPQDPGYKKFIFKRQIELERTLLEKGRSPDEWMMELSSDERKEYENSQKQFGRAMNEFFQKRDKIDERFLERKEKLEHTTAEKVVAKCFGKISFEEVATHAKLRAYIQALKVYSAKNHELFDEAEPNMMNPFRTSDEYKFLPWKVNVFVDNSTTDGAPIVAERVTSPRSLFGGLDYEVVGNSVVTDHTKIFAGAIARANGGYLVLEAKDVLFAWFFLMQTIKTREFTYENPWNAHLPIRPEPVPLNLRVIIFGEKNLMRMIAQVDAEFPLFFKMYAELLSSVKRGHKEEGVSQIEAYVAWMRQFTDEESLHSPSVGAVAKMLQYLGRKAENQEELSTSFESARTILREAHVIAENSKAEEIQEEHVECAIRERFWRMNFYYEKRNEYIRENTLLISLKGKKCGQINALTVQDFGEVSFGFPARLTAVTNIGKSSMVNIHSEAALGGEILKKADFTVQAFLKQKFAQAHPLVFEANYSFEQAYGKIDGDSASLAKVIALLSAITQIPLEQSISITGSMNILGEVQSIGGVNEKIEGFFDACECVGDLTGEQGVIIPRANKRNLMLRSDIAEAIRNKKFHVWAVETLEEAIEILTGMSAGESTPDSQSENPYLEGTFYHEVTKRLLGFIDRAKKHNEYLSSSKKEEIK